MRRFCCDALAFCLICVLMKTVSAAEPAKAPPPFAGRAICDRVRFVPAKGYEGDMVGGKIAGSNVSATEGYATLAEITEVPKTGQWNELSFHGNRPYRWLRYEAPPGAWGHISKIEFYAGKRRLNFKNFGSISCKDVAHGWPRVFDGKDQKFNLFLDGEQPDGLFVGTDTLDVATAAMPTLDPPPGSFSGPLRVTLASRTPGAVIRYTLDGTLPSSTTGSVYHDPIEIDDVTTIVAVACLEGFAPSPPAEGTYLAGPHAKPGLKSFHIGNSLTQSTNRFADYAKCAGYNHDYRRFVRPGIWTYRLWEDWATTGDEEWKTTFGGLEPLDHFTVQPRDPDIAHEAKYDLLFFDLVRQKFPDVQPWFYGEWTSRARERDWDRGRVPSAQMKEVFPALTWEESASAMFLYLEDLRERVIETYQGKKPPRVLPTTLAVGWIKPWLDQGKIPGLSGKDFDEVMFFDCVHPGPVGAMLVDATWFGAFYGQSPEGRVLPVHTGLNAEQAAAISRLAWDVVQNYPDCGMYDEGSVPVAAPEFSLSPAPIGAITRVTLNSKTPGAWFRYTLDGTTPTRTRGYVYCGTISVRPGMTVKAMAYKSGMADSAAVEATYPAIQPITQRFKIPENVVVERNIQYGQAGPDPLLLDLLHPAKPSAKPRPVIVYVHGGGWNSGDKEAGMRRLPEYAATGEYVCATINYRLSFQAAWPAQLHDCKAAIRWLRAHAKELNIDPDKIGVMGDSAGGHLSSMLALTGERPELEGTSGSPGRSSRVTCAADFCGPSDLVTFTAGRRKKNDPEMMVALLGGPTLEREDVARAASPMTYISSSAPPLLILHGTNDQSVPLYQAETFYAALKKAGVDARFIKIVGGTHGIREPDVIERVHTFFDKYLRGVDAEISEAEVQSKPAG
ncbi:MAG TPA: chitobiase/beta-hexosaminidase C-terminal domain-containing protein [Pirellulales bacterium]|nr:chitobiase/beta-hexosaminidase C-terminal domain-containing protein [Pirellulales bacterium]